MRTFEGPLQGARFFFAPRAPWAHSLTLLFVEMFYRLCPREKDSTPNKKKKHVQCAFFFLLRARPGLTHSRSFLWKCFIGSAPERRTAHRTKKKHVQCAFFFFFFSPRAARAHSLTLLFVEMFYRLGPREKDTEQKKNTSSARFFFCSPRGPGSLTHLFRSSNIINVGNRKRNARGTKKKAKMARIRSKKKCVFRAVGA